MSSIKIHRFYNLPVVDGSLLRREVNAHLHDLAAVGLVRDGIAAVVYLPECVVDVAVHLQLHDIDATVGLEQDIHAAFRCAYLCIDIEVEEREHHVERGGEVVFPCGCAREAQSCSVRPRTSAASYRHRENRRCAASQNSVCLQDTLPSLIRFLFYLQTYIKKGRPASRISRFLCKQIHNLCFIKQLYR